MLLLIILIEELALHFKSHVGLNFELICTNKKIAGINCRVERLLIAAWVGAIRCGSTTEESADISSR